MRLVPNVDSDHVANANSRRFFGIARGYSLVDRVETRTYIRFSEERGEEILIAPFDTLMCPYFGR